MDLERELLLLILDNEIVLAVSTPMMAFAVLRKGQPKMMGAP
jgi:hypothetical protein